jgi:quinolinate synthase
MLRREEIYEALRTNLKDIVPEVELRYKAELAYEINRLKKEKKALILAHHYMGPVLYHSIADIRGDSLELSRAAAQVENDVILFCGVRFMAETAKILSPEKTVLLPSEEAGCSLSESITAEDVRRLREEFPGVPIVSYINTSAAVKAESDICCTSGNCVAVVESLDADTVIFLPDEYLARNVARETSREVVGLMQSGSDDHARQENGCKLISWRGRCEVHEKFSPEDIGNARRQFSDVLILAHPECKPGVVEASDFSGSTSAMIRFIQQSNARRFLLLTECAMGENVAASFPDKEMLRLCSVRCRYMNQITLEKVLDSLRLRQYEIEIPEETRIRAVHALERMLAVSASVSPVPPRTPHMKVEF